jgi:peptidoglycan glycosyltransferase
VNRAILRLCVACLVLFGLLMINVTWLQGFQSTSLASDPQNSRITTQQFTYKRGSIVATGDGADVPIAQSRLVKGGHGQYQRYYPNGPLYAPVTGYDSLFGKTGIEEAENKELSGTDPRLEVHNLISLITGKSRQGATVSVTISPRAQRAAYQALLNDGGHQGAAVAIDPSTGAILAMASAPSFNPNQYATLNSATLAKISQRLEADPAQPLLNRAIAQTSPPGSSFKVITSSAAFSTGRVGGPQSLVSAPTQLSLGNGHVLINDDNESCGDGNPQIIEAFLLSCNTAFGKLGIDLGGATLHRYANLFGFNSSSLRIPMPVVPSVLPVVTAPPFEAYTAIGQFNDAITPLQEAMDAAAIANHGQLMTPYLVQRIQAPDESVIQSASPSMLSQPVSASVAAKVTQMMIAVTQNQAGTAYQTANKTVAGGIVIAGKTGTAQNGVNNTGLNDAVFTCFAPASDPKIAVGVIVRGGGFGAQAAAPIAVAIIRAYLESK